MRIAHVLTSFHIGGGERVTLELATGQKALGHEVLAVSLSPLPDGPLEAEFAARGLEVHHVSKRAGFDPSLSLRLAALFHEQKVAVAHLHNRQPLIYGALAGRLAGATVVHTRHGPRPGTSRQRTLERAASKLIGAYVCVTPGLREHVAASGDVDPGKLSVIENGVDVARFAPVAGRKEQGRSALGLTPDAWVVGAVGRFAPEKDFPLLVRAAAPLLGAQGKLVILGDGPEMPAVREVVRALGVEASVVLPGSRNDVADLMAAFDVFALSSRMEGLPLVALEAMATGLPVVATAVGGLPALLADGRTGFLVPSGEEEPLRQRLLSLRENRALGQEVGRRGQEEARSRYSREAMVTRYGELYLRLGASNEGPPSLTTRLLRSPAKLWQRLSKA